MSTGIETKFQNFINQNIQFKNAEPQIVLQAMIDAGIITQEEANQAAQTVFFNKNAVDVGDKFERLSEDNSSPLENSAEYIILVKGENVKEQKEHGKVVERTITHVIEEGGEEHVLEITINYKDRTKTTKKDGNTIEKRYVKKVQIGGAGDESQKSSESLETDEILPHVQDGEYLVIDYIVSGDILTSEEYFTFFDEDLNFDEENVSIKKTENKRPVKSLMNLLL